MKTYYQAFSLIREELSLEATTIRNVQETRPGGMKKKKPSSFFFFFFWGGGGGGGVGLGGRVNGFRFSTLKHLAL